MTKFALALAAAAVVGFDLAATAWVTAGVALPALIERSRMLAHAPGVGSRVLAVPEARIGRLLVLRLMDAGRERLGIEGERWGRGGEGRGEAGEGEDCVTHGPSPMLMGTDLHASLIRAMLHVRAV